MVDLSNSETIQLVSWKNKEIQEYFRKGDPKLAHLISQINPNESEKLIKLTYQYGDLIVQNGQIQIPISKNCLVPINHPDVPESLKSALDYSPIPLFFLLNKSSEVFIQTEKRAIPLNLFHPGGLLGLFETIDYLLNRRSSPMWNVSAGARSIFMLPKISETQSFKRLNQIYGIPMVLQPKDFPDHWQVFVEISKQVQTEPAWKSEVIFFPKKWIENSAISKHWSGFKDYLFSSAWSQAQFAMGRVSLNLSWEPLVDVLYSRNLFPKPALIDQIKHLILMVCGRFPGFRPSEDEQVAPMELIRNVFIKDYRLKHYFPTLVHICPDKTIHEGSQVYYSLSYPSILEGAAINSTNVTLMSHLKEIKLVLETLENRLPHHSDLYKYLVSHSFDYFHVDKDHSNQIIESTQIAEDDKAFLSLIKEYPDRKFCSTSHFFRGCIRMKSKI